MLSNSHGISLIEVLVCMSLTALLLMGALALEGRALHQMNEGFSRFLTADRELHPDLATPESQEECQLLANTFDEDYRLCRSEREYGTDYRQSFLLE